MKYLLDTQVFLWFFESPERLSEDARELMGDDDVSLFLSAASSWEMAIKWKLGKLELPAHPLEYVPERIMRLSAQSLAVQHEHALRVADLPQHHLDPFDRVLIAQAQHEKMTVITADPVFERYDVQIMRA